MYPLQKIRIISNTSYTAYTKPLFKEHMNELIFGSDENDVLLWDQNMKLPILIAQPNYFTKQVVVIYIVF